MFDELTTRGDESFEFGLFGRHSLDGARLDMGAEASDRLGIDAISLGEPTETRGVVADLVGVDDGDGVAGIGEFGDESSLIASGGFDDGQRFVGCGKFFWELLKSFRVVGEGEVSSVSQLMDVERVLGDIDADDVRQRTLLRLKEEHKGIPTLRDLRALCGSCKGRSRGALPI